MSNDVRLVVDHDADARELVASAIEAADGVAQRAASGAEALAVASLDAPQVVISDIAMPEMDSVEFLGRLRTLLGQSMPRVAIALTARAAHADRARILAAGFHQHCAKPFDPIDLIRVLHDLVSTSTTNQTR